MRDEASLLHPAAPTAPPAVPGPPPPVAAEQPPAPAEPAPALLREEVLAAFAYNTPLVI